ncbi:hypothetical protein EPO33_05505 [Patescibacteria group bacterium]|nr:MAG: hypothetical protein EPO33_05505 [Patescibacteria group bacterium]
MSELLHPPESYFNKEKPSERGDLKKLSEGLRSELLAVELAYDKANNAIEDMQTAYEGMDDRLEQIGDAIAALAARGEKDDLLQARHDALIKTKAAVRQEFDRMTEAAEAAADRHEELVEAMKAFSREVTTPGGQA